MGDTTKIDCSNGALLVDPPTGRAQIECRNRQPVQFRYDSLRQVVQATQEGRGLVSRNLNSRTVDPEGHQIEITVYHRPGSRYHTSWAHLKVDEASVNLDSYQFSLLRSAL